MSKNSIVDFLRLLDRALGSAFLTTMPSVATVEHAVCSFGIFSISTVHMRH